LDVLWPLPIISGLVPTLRNKFVTTEAAASDLCPALQSQQATDATIHGGEDERRRPPISRATTRPTIIVVRAVSSRLTSTGWETVLGRARSNVDDAGRPAGFGQPYAALTAGISVPP